MGKEPSLEHPWQKSPTQLIRYAESLIEEGSDFKNQLAFLLIDIGVETMLTTYLSLSQDVTGAKTEYSERKKSLDKRTFHSLLTGVREAIGEDIDDIDFNQVMYFHSIRNKLYHLGDGIVPTNENLQEYLNIAQDLLRELMGVELSKTSVEYKSVSSEEFSKDLTNILRSVHVLDDVEISLTELRCDIAVAVEVIRPDWAKRSTEKRLRDIWKEYPDDENEEYWIRTELQENRLKRFNEVLGTEANYSWIIDKSLQDITYLHLAVISERLNRDLGQELNVYSDACKFLDKYQSRELNDIEEIISRSDQIIAWVRNLQEIIEKLIDEEDG